MDRFKFRAWDNVQNKMLLPDKDKAYISLVGTFCCVEDEKDSWELIENRNYRHILMQCTGLKDKNDKLIYEGDVVTMPDTYTESVDVGIGMVPVAQDKFNSICIIKYEKGGFGVNVPEETENYIQGFNSFYELDIAEIEIIGNIYENKELLNEVS